jgi:hypothetical protein
MLIIWRRHGNIRLFWRAPPHENVLDEEAMPVHISFRRNKDKFVASLLVDLRVHHPQLEGSDSQSETANETDESFTGSASRFTNSSVSDSSSDRDDLGSQDTPGFMNSTAPATPQSVIRRRRFVTPTIEL